MKCWGSFKVFADLLVLSNKGEYELLNTNDIDSGFCKHCLGVLNLLSLLCRGNSSEFYYLDELVFVPSNTQVETAEQFILLYTSYV